jgi:anaerobic ribonucleoside-triphosphate reductase activating protein
MAEQLRVGGFVPLTTLDYPDHLSCVVFCQGCAWRCRYCHNPDLIPPRAQQMHSWESILEFLQRRQGLLEAVVFSGGEATLQQALKPAMQEVKKLGFKVGLHTAGINPKALERVLPECDWVGFDVKALAENTELITGVPGSGQANWQCLDLLLASGIDYECRTTVHWDLLDPQGLLQLAQRLSARGVAHFVVQHVRTQGMLDEQLTEHNANLGTQALWHDISTLFSSFVRRND